MAKVWVVLPDNGYEGLGEPDIAFLDETEARSYADRLAKSGHCLFKVASVELWRFTPTGMAQVEVGPSSDTEARHG